jgi:GWxTD domain-containing protein
MRTRSASIILTLLVSASLIFPGQTKIKPKDLAAKYQEWLKLTTYIITEREKDVFMSLPNDRDRDVFMETFWKVRDPTPGTPVNEFKEEHIKRFQEADKRFRRRSARAGWMTDQGRFYIILGPPISTEDIAGTTEIYPCEIWSYYGDAARGMPQHFSLVFYQRGGSGEYKLYDPVSDGPGRLIIGSEHMDAFDYQAFYQKLYDLYPSLALVCLSIIPGEIPYAYQPSPENSIMMANILNSPKKFVNESYATHFLNYRGVVSTEYLTNYIDSEINVAVAHDPISGMAFCDFAMSPAQLSLDYFEPKDYYFCAFQVDVSLRAGEKIVFQYSKEFPLTIPADQLQETQSMGVCIADSFPMIEGKYQLTVLLRNTTGKEFSILESPVEILGGSGRPRLIGPVFGYKLTDAQVGMRLPYQAMDKRLNIDPKNTYAAADQIILLFNISGLTRELWKEGTVGIFIKGSRAGNPYQKSFSVPLGGQAFHEAVSFTHSLAAAELLPDYYDLALTLKDRSGNVLDERKANFIRSPEKAVSHPIIASKASSLANSFLLYYMLAYQYDQINENEKAEAMYKKAYSLNPAYLQRIPEYAGLLLKVKKYGEALALIEAIKGDEKLRFQYYFNKGRAQMGLEKHAEAIDSFLQGNKVYNSDTGLLNALGQCYYKTGQIQSALNALNASLKLNPDQADVKKLIQTIEEKK